MVERSFLGARFASQMGVAIGPILFIIALLAILAAAIAAGGGSFTAGTTSESDRTKSSALIQIGENLKLAMERLSNEQSVVPSQVDFNLQNVTATNDLFSPSGGAITPPSVAMANNPSSDQWYYVSGPINGLGTSADEIYAVLAVSPGVCAEINNRVTGVASTPAANDLGDFTSGATVAANSVTNWPFQGRSVGCVVNNDNSSSGDYFYQVMAIQ